MICDVRVAASSFIERFVQLDSHWSQWQIIFNNRTILFRTFGDPIYNMIVNCGN